MFLCFANTHITHLQSSSAILIYLLYDITLNTNQKGPSTDFQSLRTCRTPPFSFISSIFSSITRIHPSPPLNLIHCSLIYCPQRSLTMPLKVGFMRLQFHSGGGAGRVNPIRLSSHGDTLTWQKWWLLWNRVVCRRESDNVRERGRNIEINWGNSKQNRPSWVLRVYFHLHITWIF